MPSANSAFDVCNNRQVTSTELAKRKYSLLEAEEREQGIQFPESITNEQDVEK